jgi:hypothetical protein
VKTSQLQKNQGCKHHYQVLWLARVQLVAKVFGQQKKTQSLEEAVTKPVKKQDRKWVAVAAMVPGRTNTQWRQLWVKVLDHTVLPIRRISGNGYYQQ